MLLEWKKAMDLEIITLPFLPEASSPPLKSMPPLIPVQQSMFFLQQVFK